MTQAICDITTDEVNVDVVVEPQADTMVAVANRAGGMEQVFHDNTLTGNGNSVDLGVNTEIIATKEYVDENKVDAYTKTEIDNKVTVINAEIDANADAIQKTRDDFINADSEIHQILNNHADELTTLRGNQASLGDQVSGIEEKIPGSASATNQLVTKEDLKSIDLEGYATTDYVDTIEQEIRGDINAEDAKLQTQITAQATAITTNKNDIDELGDDVAEIQAKIPESASGSNPLVTKQQLLDEEMDIRDDLNEGLGELQTQITAQAAEIATKQDKLTAGDNIIISGNVISATGAGGGAGFDVIVVQELPAEGQKGIIYLLAKDGEAPDIYDEYIWVTATLTFEFIGTTQVDLSGYATKEDLENIDALPDQSGNSGKFLTTDGTTASWSDKPIVNNTNYDSSIGVGSKATSYNAVVIGTGIQSVTNYSVTIGYNARTNTTTSVAVGANAYANNHSIALGSRMYASAEHSIQIGSSYYANISNTDPNTFKVYNGVDNYEIMSADGTIPAERMSATAGTTGQVLTKTDAGMEWQEPSGGTTITLKEYDE